RIAGELNLPPENLITPDSVRRLAWTPPEEITDETVAQALRASGARAWQIKLIAAQLASALPAPATAPPAPRSPAASDRPA
ncbi:MAG TPA: hypothetical protein VFR67_02005, partial [Pilimelia sp.]|nr:hypothetical protein [Pilimelia sp.]